MREIKVERTTHIDFLFYLRGLGILDKITICGSYGLKLNGFLDRRCHDLDILTSVDWYHYNPFRLTAMDNEQRSHKFNVGDQKITCTKVKFMDLGVDLLYNTTFNAHGKYEEVKLIVDDNLGEGIEDYPGYNNELIVRVEDPSSAIRFKQQYIKTDNSEESRKKHMADFASEKMLEALIGLIDE